jgi:hypothetical protein
MLTPAYTNDLIQNTRFSNVSMRTGHLLFAVQFVFVYSIMEYVPVPFNAYIRVNPSFPKDLVPEMTAFFD